MLKEAIMIATMLQITPENKFQILWEFKLKTYLDSCIPTQNILQGHGPENVLIIQCVPTKEE